MAISPSPARQRFLVVLDEGIASDSLRPALAAAGAASHDDIRVVAPALTSRLREWFGNIDQGRANAAARLDQCLDVLHREGISATGTVGDTSPRQAIADQLRIAPADTVVMLHPVSDLVRRRDVDASIPVTHVSIAPAGNVVALFTPEERLGYAA
ncbi:MAG: hypothetical protein F2663_04760 [Actinobacteria bacterium]|uniref:Unannotated protein n=1 Tax=freshwater metagenome TaxID=449393 RepID=A0A6J6P7Y5_9ZZZZ|nr:hypothetical protein [Actinomycetota bacterium]